MTSRPPAGRLVRKYVVVLLVLVGGVLMASSLVELYFSYRETQRAIVRVERAKAVAAAGRIEQFLKEIEAQVRETAQTASDDPDASQTGPGRLGFREGLGAALAEQRELDFLRLLRNAPAIAELRHLDLAGKEQLRVSRLDLDVVGSQEDLSRAPSFVEARAGKTYWSPIYLRNESDPYVTLAVPVGKYALEVTTAEVSLGAVPRIVSQIELGPGGYAYVVDARNRLVAHPDRRLVREQRDLSGLAQVKAARAEGRSAAADAPAAMVAEGLAGGRVLAAHAAIAAPGWLVFVERPAADAYAPLRAPIVRSAIIFVLGLGLSVLASVLLARRMVAPIRALREGAARIGAGDLGHRIEVRTGDELEALGEEFNRAAARLEESHANLEQKVEVRTRELAAANADLTEALEQQTATGEILRVISSSPTDVQPVFAAVAASAARLCEAFDATIYRVDGDALRLVAHEGPIPAPGPVGQVTVPLVPGIFSGRVVLERRTIHVDDLQAVAGEYPEGSDFARRHGARTMLGVPLLRAGEAIGLILLRRTEVAPFTERQAELLKTFADQAVIAIENVRLFQELEARNRDLTETLEQQTATSEILRVISGSRADVQPVFETIAANALRLCGATFSAVSRFDGELIRLAALHNLNDPEGAEAVRRLYPMPPSRGGSAARAILTGAVAYTPDVDDDPEYRHADVAHAARFRSIVSVPMLRDDRPVGAISAAGASPGAFSSRQIDLLRTFADQAVIAIENVRLFQQLEARTQELTRSVGELRALGEVSQAVGSTLDLEAVLATIVSRAVPLSGSHGGIVYEFDESTQTFHAQATHEITPEHLAVIRTAPIRLGEGAVGRAGVIRRPVEVADIADEEQVVAPQTRHLLVQEGLGSLLAVPLVREDRILGGLVVLRRERGGFSPEVVGILQTFAAQSVLAIHNARLFREVQRQKQYADALVETSPVAIVTMDLGTAVVGWNPGAERLFGYTAAEAVGRQITDLIATPEMREEVRAAARQTLAGERVRAITRRVCKDGSPVDVETSAMPVVVDGTAVGIIAIYHDITELLRARREAEAANEAKSAFLATMSHEIRTPMNAVIGMSGLLLNTGLTDEQREYAELVRQSGDALLTIINDILDFSKIEAGKLELESQPFDLRECLEAALDLVAPRAAEKGLDLAYLVADGTPAVIVGDVTRLRQILLNLLSNAVKFTERGEVVLSVSAAPADGGVGLHGLAFSVRDTGIGIPPDRLGRLFQSFSQVDASTTRRYGGTGLGLAISQRLAGLMGGRIEVSSEVGRGSEFRFTIRAAAAEAPVAARRDLGGVEPSLHGKAVLVVDDNGTNRRILTAHLSRWGMRPRATGTPAEALEWIRAGEPFDAGILDMHMPDMDGVSLARAIRAEAAGRTLPLILFTSLGRREARADAEPFAAYLNKPIKPSQLFDALISVVAARPVRAAEPGVARAELDADMGRRHPLRILLAEDNVVNQKVALRLLGQMGYRADVAANGLEAIDALERQPYDVVLMDVQMPELDGFEASREINRRWPGERRPRIVAMTANAMQGDRERCEAAGMDDYVSKPIRVEELVAALERCRRRGGPRARSTPAADAGDPAGPAREPVDAPTFGRLATTMGGPFVAELIDAFVEDGRRLVVTLEAALAGADPDAFRRAAHTLKSNAEMLGAARLAAGARELEAMARAGRLEGAADRVARLAAEYEAVSRALAELRRGLPA